MGVWPKVMGGAGSATCERDGVEASWDGQGRAEDPGHQLVSWVSMYGCAGGVSLVFPPTVFCGGGDMRTVRDSQYVNTLHWQVVYIVFDTALQAALCYHMYKVLNSCSDSLNFARVYIIKSNSIIIIHTVKAVFRSLYSKRLY